MPTTQVEVSIICIAYNHEKYIQDCLEGFVRQKTSFAYEVLIHDDASTDGTAEIIRTYKGKYPDIIKPIFQTENQYSKGIPIVEQLILPLVQGKYVALCEGDDYWTDPLKLQKQYDALEAHPECHLCIHQVRVLSEEGKALKRNFPVKDILTGCISGASMLGIYFHICSFLMRTSDYRDYAQPGIKFRSVSLVGDGPLQMFFAQFDKNYYINEPMANYRFGTSGSWTNRFSHDIQFKKNVIEGHIACYIEYNRYTNYKFDKYCRKCILTYQLRVFRLGGEAKAIRNSEYKSAFWSLSCKDKLIFISAWCPFVFKVLDWLRNH